ncbi:MAG: hypothetical protein KBC33_03435 [Candidatus Pacebacteria bacterium]|nr:hypothetical protein [Candidatus Paceibacterota bacterium]
MAKGAKMDSIRFQWALFFGALFIIFVLSFAFRVFTNCILEWPVRWDISVCWHEQVQPSKNEAIEKASMFLPDRLP